MFSVLNINHYILFLMGKNVIKICAVLSIVVFPLFYNSKNVSAADNF